ncbi:restriction endonuclease subunit S [Alishewanella sp. HL-SH05]|uniref:restriction endonuclease subunit S n=1 Tax=Alishewanella sp. HL-SH05 TaxID=3461145 RepID=UPI0040414F6C
MPLGEVGEWKSGGTPAKNRNDYWDGNIPWFSPKDMKDVELKKSILTVTESGANNGTRLVEPNTIMIVVRGMILAHTFPVGITNQVSTFNQDMKALVVNEGFEPRFILHWLIANSDLFLQKVSVSTHGTCRLGSEIFKEMLVPKPKLHEQLKILKRFDEINKIQAELLKDNTRVIRSSLLN